FSNGQVRLLGQIALASFNNPEGLSKSGSNLYQVSNNSGMPQVGLPGDGGRGSLTGAALGMSNVDLSEEFTEMIVAQRGFQANTRIITTSDEI
ncbi:flagellar hook-basal body complex protein, partial [Pseudomonas sp. 2822-17]|uniref:flagellar hook-basal body complex protein n=1 Tax=Pseudomonas sp. 2822-17 TaxID=1712678 RepID=UPI00117B6165